MVETAPTDSRRKLGELLVAAGVLNDDSLRIALGHQRKWGGRLGQILIDLRLIEEHILAQTLAKQLGLELCPIGEGVPIETVRMVPQLIAERYACFPVRFDAGLAGGTLTIAFSDPTNLSAIDEVQVQTGKRLDLAVATEGQISQAIRHFYYGEGLPAPAPVAEAASLFGGVDSMLAEEDGDVVDEIEPIPSDSQLPQTGTPNASTLHVVPSAPSAPSDLMADFFNPGTKPPEPPPPSAPSRRPPPHDQEASLPPPLVASSEAPGFSQVDVGEALSLLDETKGPVGSPPSSHPVALSANVDYGKVAVRLLLKKGLIDEAELMAELAKE